MSSDDNDFLTALGVGRFAGVESRNDRVLAPWVLKLGEADVEVLVRLCNLFRSCEGLEDRRRVA